MLGMEDTIIAFAWIATVLSAAFCVVFGILFWNRKGDDTE